MRKWKITFAVCLSETMCIWGHLLHFLHCLWTSWMSIGRLSTKKMNDCVCFNKKVFILLDLNQEVLRRSILSFSFQLMHFYHIKFFGKETKGYNVGMIGVSFHIYEYAFGHLNSCYYYSTVWIQMSEIIFSFDLLKNLNMNKFSIVVNHSNIIPLRKANTKK